MKKDVTTNPTTLPFAVAADLWSELHDAHFGRNEFGTDTAEIYGYRLRGDMAYTDAKRTVSDSRAGQNLHALVTTFVEDKPSRVTIDGKKFGEWVKELRIEHRVHVQVLAFSEMELNRLLEVSSGERAGVRGRRIGVTAVDVNRALGYPYTADETLVDLRAVGCVEFESRSEETSPNPIRYLITEKGKDLLREHGKMSLASGA